MGKNKPANLLPIDGEKLMSQWKCKNRFFLDSKGHLIRVVWAKKCDCCYLRVENDVLVDRCQFYVTEGTGDDMKPFHPCTPLKKWNTMLPLRLESLKNFIKEHLEINTDLTYFETVVIREKSIPYNFPAESNLHDGKEMKIIGFGRINGVAYALGNIHHEGKGSYLHRLLPLDKLIKGKEK